MFVGCSGFVSVAAKGSGAALMAVPSPPDQRCACPAWALAALGRFPIIPSHCPLTWVGVLEVGLRTYYLAVGVASSLMHPCSYPFLGVSK